MKKYLLIFILISFVIPVSSADVDIYGKFGMSNWWMKSERFYNDSIDKDTVIIGNDTSISKIWGADSMPIVSCNMLPFGKLGLAFKSDRFGGCVEFSISMNTYDNFYTYNPTTHRFFKKSSYYAAISKWYGEWYINDNFTLLAGKNTAPACFFPSNQAFWRENGLNNVGCLYTGSHPMMQLSIHDANKIVNCKIAAIKPDTTLLKVKNKDTWRMSYVGQTKMPKFEGSVEINLDKDLFGFRFEGAGGFQRYTSIVFGSDLPADESYLDINSWVAGADLGIRLGPVSLTYDIFYGMNIGTYGVYIGEQFGWWRIADYMRPFYPIQEVDTMNNGYALEMAAIVQYKPIEMLSIEAGGGTVIGTHDYEEYKERWDQTYAWYFQSQLHLFEHLTVTPEVGQYIYGPHMGFGRYIYGGFNFFIQF